MRRICAVGLLILLSGCATLELTENEDHYRGRWFAVKDGDRQGKTGFARVDAHVRDDTSLEGLGPFAAAIQKNGLPDHVYVVNTIRVRIAYTRRGQIEEWHVACPYVLVKTYSWKDYPYELPPTAVASKGTAPQPAAAKQAPAPQPAPKPVAAAEPQAAASKVVAQQQVPRAGGAGTVGAEEAAMAAYQANPTDELLEKLISIRAARGMALCAQSMEKGNPDLYVQGLSYMDSALDLASDNARLYSMAGLCYAMAADEDEAARATAREYLEYALYLDDTLVDAQLVLGSLYFDAGEFTLAIEPFEACVKSMGAATPSDVADALAQSYAKTYLTDQGLAFFSETLKSKPGNTAARLGRARLLSETKRNREALEELRVIIKDPQADDAYREAARRLSLAWEVAK